MLFDIAELFCQIVQNYTQSRFFVDRLITILYQFGPKYDQMWYQTKEWLSDWLHWQF